VRPPVPTPDADSRCPRCNVEFNISDAPVGLAVVWITCPECKIRFWQPEAQANMVLDMRGFEDAKTSWQPGQALH
jgi:hypothetical protein